MLVVVSPSYRQVLEDGCSDVGIPEDKCFLHSKERGAEQQKLAMSSIWSDVYSITDGNRCSVSCSVVSGCGRQRLLYWSVSASPSSSLHISYTLPSFLLRRPPTTTSSSDHACTTSLGVAFSVYIRMVSMMSGFVRMYCLGLAFLVFPCGSRPWERPHILGDGGFSVVGP